METRRLLKERYGRRYTITAMHVKKLIEGPWIKPKDGTVLEQFPIQLSSCINLIEGNWKMTIAQLPFGIRLKWCDADDHIIKKEN